MRLRRQHLNLAALLVAPTLFVASAARAAQVTRAATDDILIADFEGENYGAWKAEGTAFGSAPARGTLPNQMAVAGYRGRGLVNSFAGGDDATGKLTSPPFVIRRRFINFLIGGGRHWGRTGLNLRVNGAVVRSATGPNDRPGGNENLSWASWDVARLIGQTVTLEIVDQATGGWGHINVDEIMQSNVRKAEMPATRNIAATKKWLNFPVKNGAKKRIVTVSAGGKVQRRFEIELADAQPDWWAPLDVSAWRGQTLAVTVDQLAADSNALAQVTQSDAIAGAENLYREALRPQFHFSAQRGWLNDPNGLVFYRGEYHLFFQHVPYGWGDGPKHWGQAVSRDLVHWQEVGEALYPDEFGAMWSGSAVVDWKNTSGFGKNGEPPPVLIYTAAGDPFTQCIAYSTDGRRFTKFAGNPVVKNISGGNRDPKVIWHEPTQRWVQVLYVEKEGRHTVHFFTSPNLRDWTLTDIEEGKPNSAFLYECPDFFELPLDGDAAKKKWVLIAADSQYAVGSFDGAKFTAETPNLPGHRGRGFYAPQTFSDEPKGRRIQIGWFQTETRGMPFNQSMSLPLEMRLVSTPDGPRLTWNPVPELASLRARSHTLGAQSLKEGDANPLAAISGELFEIGADFELGDAGEIAFDVRGVPVVFDVKTQELIVNGHRVSAPLRQGRQRLTIFADRTGLEVFAGDGAIFVPMPINLNSENKSVAVSVRGGSAQFSRLDVHELRSAWRK